MGKSSAIITHSAGNVSKEIAMVSKVRWRNLVAFWILGMCNDYGYSVMLSAAYDIIESKFGDKDTSLTTNSTPGIRTCNTVSSSAILLADVLPALIIKMTAPFLPFLVHVRVAICVLLSAAGFLVVSLSTTEWHAFLGVVITSLSFGLSEVTLISYSNQFSEQVIWTWSSGTGGAGVISAVSYAGLTMVLSTENTLLVMLIVPLLQAITFWLILVHPHTKVPITKNGINNQEQIIEIPEKNFRDKIKLLPGLMKYIIPLGLMGLFGYFVNQGLLELIEFNGTWLTHAEQYRWLLVINMLGVFISSSVNIISINRVWIICVLQFINVIIFIFETIYYYIPNIWIVFAISLWQGLLGGASYVNTFCRMSKEIPRVDCEVSLGMGTLAETIGIMLAGLLSMPVHNAICKLPQPKRLGS